MGENSESNQNGVISIRAATPDDISLIYDFIQKKSDFDRDVGAFSGVLKVSELKLGKTLFDDKPFAYVLFGEQDDKACGFALYGFRYSSFVGQPSVWLDDLYVDSHRRGQGVGTLLMQRLAQVAKQHDCTHLAWTADARNSRGLRFYARLGAQITAQDGNRCFLKWIPKMLD